MKKGLAVLILCVFAFMLAGCQTAKGFTTGAATTIKGTAEGAASDTVGLWGALMKFDQWIRDNMW